MAKKILGKRREAPKEAPKPPRTFDEPTLPGRIEVYADQATQVQALALALEDVEARKMILALGVDEDSFTIKEYAELWGIVEQANERNIEIDKMTVAALTSDVKLIDLSENIRGHKPPRSSLVDVVERLRWNSSVIVAAEAVPEFAEFLRKRSRPDDVLRAARAIVTALETGRPVGGRNSSEARLAERQIEAIKLRKIRGRHPFGIPGFDVDEAISDEADPKRYRTTIGVAPAKVTVVTALSGNGKSTLIANIIRAQVRTFGKKVLMGAWEDEPGEVLELVAAIDQGINLTRLVLGELTDDEEGRLADVMVELQGKIEFMGHPLERVRNHRNRNDEVLEMIQSRIIETGAQVAIFDIWARAFAFGSEQEESEALYRQQAIAKATQAHCILAQQQGLKTVEKREDPRPSREGTKGSGEWTGIADTMLGVFRPDLYKVVPPGTIEIPILKQRRGRWPIGIEADFDAEYGLIKGCRTVTYDSPGAKGENSKNELERAIAGKRKKK